MVQITFGNRPLNLNVGESAVIAFRAAQRAEAAASVFVVSIGAFVSKAAGVETGIYFADFSVPYTRTLTRFYAAVASGTDTPTATVSMLKNGAPFFGPVTVGATPTDTTGLALESAAGDNFSMLIEYVTGTPTSVVVKLEG